LAEALLDKLSEFSMIRKRNIINNVYTVNIKFFE